ncbi:preprotein translocase subunit SecE [Candidatus Curtissbacteria bacterium RBG_13_40_7]|uniref:Protein translocase subunit SecE n=1 Tax=Candidatus Curtissbacteria bacterium RBG_13_40_7 TaxID=1797706 RepID=A0A1F5FX66_9BACT|nr:MAG: preprotein translocase subunit SecE [Candidatus Curtissbacteria bacterium RBG_13_40_7]
MSLNPLNYVKESKAELEKVIWPTRMEAIRLTILVVIVSVIVGAYIAGLDAIFAKFTETFLR